jgi:hypothetical protein
VLVLTFAETVDLERAIFRNGSQEDFRSRHRPHELHLVYSNNQSHDIKLKDTPEKQEVDLKGGRGVTSVEIYIRSFHTSQGADMALSDVELFGEKIAPDQE